MSRKLILAEITTILKEVDSIGKVYDSVRWVIEESKFNESFIASIADQQQIRAWIISRVSGQDGYGAMNRGLGTLMAVPVGTRLNRYDFTIEGFMSFKDDETEAEFQDLVDSIRDKFKDNISLNSSALERGNITYKVGHTRFGEYLVHHAVIDFWAIERDGIVPV